MKLRKLKAGFLLAVIICMAFSWLTRAYSSAELPTPEQPTQFYSSQLNQDLQQVFLDAFDQAEKSINIMIYALKDKPLIYMLNRKNRQGVKIMIVCDAQASRKLHGKLDKEIEVVPRLTRGLMHNKIVTIDEEKVYIGSANMTGESLKVHANLVVGIYSPEMAKLINKKTHSLLAFERSQLIPTQTFQVGDQTVELWFLPDNKEGYRRISQLIKSAKKSVKVAMFTWTRPDLAEEVIAARERGVDVQVILDRHSASGASKKIVAMFEEANLPYRINRGPGLLHHKMLIVDDRVIEIGSANWTRAAFNSNDDNFIVVSPLNNVQRKQLDKLWRRLFLESE